jgi:hypothetical protein
VVKAVLVSLAVTFAWLLLQNAWVHLFKPTRIFRGIALAFFVSWPLVPVVYWSTPADLGFLPVGLSGTPPRVGVAAAVLLHLLFFFNWCQFFFYVDRSITLRLLVEFVKSPDGVRTLDEIRGVYDLERMIRARMSVLHRNGWLVKGPDGRDRLTWKAKFVARGTLLLRKVFGIGFYTDFLKAPPSPKEAVPPAASGL